MVRSSGAAPAPPCNAGKTFRGRQCDLATTDDRGAQLGRDDEATMPHDDTTRSYSSGAGYRMWGGDPHARNEVSGKTWISLAVMVGVALAIGTWMALRG